MRWEAIDQVRQLMSQLSNNAVDRAQSEGVLTELCDRCFQLTEWLASLDKAEAA